MRVMWRIHTYDMTKSCVWCDSFIFVMWLVYTCGDLTHLHVWCDSFTPPRMGHVSHTWTYLCKRWRRCTQKSSGSMGHVTHVNGSWVMSQTWMSHKWIGHVTHKWIHLRERHGTHSNVGYPLLQCIDHIKAVHRSVMSHIWIGHESCHTYRLVMSHVTHTTWPWVMLCN